MNNNYPRYQITSTYGEVSVADYYYAQSELSMERGDLFIGFAEFTIGNNATSYLHLATGAENNLQLVHFSISTESDAFTEEFIESPLLSEGSTELSVYNSNRQSTKTPSFTIYTDSTYTSGGTVIYQDTSFGERKSTNMDSGNGFSRIQFKKDTDYMLALTNTGGGNKDFFARFYFHELT
jgi:hypothetical protein